MTLEAESDKPDETRGTLVFKVFYIYCFFTNSTFASTAQSLLIFGNSLGCACLSCVHSEGRFALLVLHH